MAIFDTLRRMFGRKAFPKNRLRLTAHELPSRRPQMASGGIASRIGAEADEFMRSRPERDQRLAKRQEKFNDPEVRFIVQGEWLETPQSSYMAACFYNLIEQTLHVIHHDHSMYGYRSVTPEMARSLYRAGSKGTWMWDNIRIRGTVYGHRVPYWLEMQPSAEFTPGRGEGPYGARKWATNVRTAMERDVKIQELGQFQQVQRQIGNETFSTLMSKFARKVPIENTGRRLKVGPRP